MIAIETIVVRKDGIMDTRIDDTIVLMSVENEQFFELETSSRAIWERIKEPKRVRDLCLDIAGVYQVSLETVQSDIVDFLCFLEAKGMIASQP
jgi:hypothetical protein